MIYESIVPKQNPSQSRVHEALAAALPTVPELAALFSLGHATWQESKRIYLRHLPHSIAASVPSFPDPGPCSDDLDSA